MITAYCNNCAKYTGHKRAIGAGTLVGGVLTGGVSLLAIPLYPKRCIVCGLTTGEGKQVTTPSSPASSLRVTKADQVQGWIVLIGVVALLLFLFAFAQHCSEATHTSQDNAPTVTNAKQKPGKTPTKQPH